MLWRARMFAPSLRRVAIGAGVVLGIVVIAFSILWWRLSSGPIALDAATPWITAAIEQNFGTRHKVQIGGTILERDAKGRTALRLRDIVVRDPQGEVVAVAKRAEIGVSGTSLLLGRPRVSSFLLVGANFEIRVDPDGHVEIYAGGRRPLLAISPVSLARQDMSGAPPVAPSSSSPQPSEASA
jgi:uncharacterized protein YhdP